MNIFFTSDTHFGHDKEFLFGPRGFDNWIECGEAIVENWNSIVKPEDTVYHLGDMMLTKPNEEQSLCWIKELNGNIKWILGNHDTDARVATILSECKNIELCGFAQRMKLEGYSFYLSHYPTLTCNDKDPRDKGMKNMMNSLFGHTHQQTNGFEGRPNMYHVGLDSHNLKPVSLEEVINDLKKQYNE